MADEGCYLKYATYIADNGIAGFKTLFKLYVQDKTNIFPNPLRSGFIILSCVWLKAFGYSFINLSYLSLVSFCVFLFISFYFVKKYFDENIAILFVMLLAFSPINMSMARRALLDSTSNLFSCLSIWLFLGFLKKRGIPRYAFFVLIYAFTILIKETSVLLSAVFLIFILLNKVLFKKRIYIADILSVTLFPFALVALVYIYTGGLRYTIDTVRIILSSPKTNPYAVAFGQGPWFRYIIDYMLLSPWVVILSIGFLFYYVISKEHNEVLLYLLVVFIFSFLLFNLFSKNIRYVLMLDMPMRLFSVIMLKDIVSRKFPRHAIILITALVLMISLSDYLNFNNLFLRHGIYDPVSYELLRVERFIP